MSELLTDLPSWIRIVGLLFFVVLFAAVVLYVLGDRRKKHIYHMSNMPLNDDTLVTSISDSTPNREK